MHQKKSMIFRIALALIVLTGSEWTPNVKGKDIEAITCTGKIVDEQGRPIAGAKVSLYEIVYDQATSTYDSKVLRKVHTGTDGIFSFSKMIDEHQYRRGQIVAEKEGLALGFDEWNMRNGDMALEITLGPPKKLAGIVVDENNAPVSGARVIVSILAFGEGRQRKSLTGVIKNLLETDTNAKGQFVFSQIPAGATAEFITSKTGRATVSTYKRSGYAYQKLNFTEGQTDIKLVMPAEAIIEGLVVEKNTGKPVGDLRIKHTSGQEIGYFRPKPSVSKDDGTFKVRALSPGRYVLDVVQPREQLADWVAEPVEVVAQAGQVNKNVKIELSKGGLLEVLVTETETGNPLEGVSISIYHQRRRQSYRGRTGVDGIGQIRLLSGVYQWGHAYKANFASLDQREPVTIEADTTKRLEWQLSPLPKVTGVVRDQAGKPIEGAILAVCPMGGSRDIQSDAEGKFEVSWDSGRDIHGRQPPLLVCRYVEDNLAVITAVPEGAKTLDIDLSPAVIVTGKVVNPVGQGINDARIGIMLRQTTWGSTMTREAAKTDSEGNFEIKAIPVEHQYDLIIKAKGYGNTRIDIHADDAIDNRLKVGVLTLPVANLAVSGLVVDKKGNPIADARIESYNYEGGQPERLIAQTDSQGKFTIDGVCEGKLNIRVNANHNGKRLSAFAITNGGASGIKIIAREGRSVVQNLRTKTYNQILQDSEKVIAGMVVDETGSAVAGVPVGVCCHKRKRENGKFSWTFSSYEDLTATTDREGRFAIALKEDGEYNLRFSPDHHAAIIEYDIPIGTKDLKVTLPKGGMVTGHLIRIEKGRKIPIPNVEVKIEQTDRASYTHLGFERDRTTMTDADGRFRFEHLRTKIRPHRSMSKKKWDHIARFWKISYGDTSKNIAFYEDTQIDDFELIVRPKFAKAQSIVGRKLPGFEGITVDLSDDQMKNMIVLVCFFDMNQRPSRHYMTQLVKRAQQFDQTGILCVTVQVSQVDQIKLNEWIKANSIPYKVGIVQDDREEIRSIWGVKSLPWLILADKEHFVILEGFTLTELSEVIKQNTAGN